jgi:hypothetical protein
MRKRLWLIAVGTLFLFMVLALLVPFVPYVALLRASSGVPPMPLGYPTTLASKREMGRILLVHNYVPAQFRPTNYEYIMPESQQRQILRNSALIKKGEPIDEIIRAFGPPLSDQLDYGEKDNYFLPADEMPRPGRVLTYCFAKRSLPIVNEFDPCLQFFFDPTMKLRTCASNVDGIASFGTPGGLTAATSPN